MASRREGLSIDDAHGIETDVRIGSTTPVHLKFILYRNKKVLEEEFAKDGIKIELTTFDGGSAASVALGSGAIDFTYIGNNPSLRLAASGADVELIGLSSWARSNETQIVVRADSPIQKIEDLKGKKVAYLSVCHSTFAKALKSVGLGIADVESLNLGIEAPALHSCAATLTPWSRATARHRSLSKRTGSPGL